MSPGNCPTGCGRNARPGHLMCGPCWAEVPKFLQYEVLRTWRTYSRFTGLAQSPERTAARKAYQAARDNAIGAVP